MLRRARGVVCRRGTAGPCVVAIALFVGKRATASLLLKDASRTDRDWLPFHVDFFAGVALGSNPFEAAGGGLRPAAPSWPKFGLGLNARCVLRLRGSGGDR